MTQSRDPATIQREIEQTRAQLASTLDDLAERASPKRLASLGRSALTDTPRGRAILAGAAGLVLLLIGRRVLRGRRD